MATPTTREIIDYSPLNSGGKEKIPEYKRNLYSELRKDMPKRYILAITGLRRVGKTTLIKQILNERGGAYFSFDEQRYRNVESLSVVIETFIRRGEKTIALDEIGYVNDWAGTIKKYYDRGGIKFIISGSSSLSVKKGKESLAGRMFEYHLPPMQFDEYLTISRVVEPKKDIWNMQPQEAHLQTFLAKGAFPEIHREDEDTVRRYVITLAEKILFEDIPSVYGVEYKSKLNDLLHYIATFSASQFSESSVGNTIGVSKNTAGEYAFYLSQAFLSTILYEYGSYARALQKTKKAYVNCTALYRTLTDSYSEGTEAEVAVLDRIRAWKDVKEIKFYRDYQKREVDFVIDRIPIEVKYRTYIKEEDFDNLLYFMKEKKLKAGIMITKEMFDIRRFGERQVMLIPLSIFLACERKEKLVGGFELG